MKTASVALDLGSTRIKAARLREDGSLGAPESEAAPPLHGDGAVREGDAREYLRAAGAVLSRALEGLPNSVPLGIASQRSSFLLWERSGGTPVTPLISWQDRRAAAWCERHRDDEARVTERTGLVLSPHYLGPKLATILERDEGLRRRARDGDLMLGTLDTWLLWNWSDRAAHRTDPTLAARTLLYDLDAGEWSDALLGLFGVPRALLPRIEPSAGRPLPLAGRGTLRATLGDQASGVLAAAGTDDGTALVNFGTGTFVLRPTHDRRLRPAGYLAGPALVPEDGPTLYALEGPVNGGAAAVDRHGAGPTGLPAKDPSPEAFCLPDSAGIGAPHWRGDVELTFSDAARALPNADRRRVVMEGLVFRVAEILDDLFPDGPPRTVLLSGGLANDPFLPAALAGALQRDVSVSEEKEGTLLGVARLAAGLKPRESGPAHPVAAGAGGGYLAKKRARWHEWTRSVLR